MQEAEGPTLEDLANTLHRRPCCIDILRHNLEQMHRPVYICPTFGVSTGSDEKPFSLTDQTHCFPSRADIKGHLTVRVPTCTNYKHSTCMCAKSIVKFNKSNFPKHAGAFFCFFNLLYISRPWSPVNNTFMPAPLLAGHAQLVFHGIMKICLTSQAGFNHPPWIYPPPEPETGWISPAKTQSQMGWEQKNMWNNGMGWGGWIMSLPGWRVLLRYAQVSHQTVTKFTSAPSLLSLTQKFFKLSSTKIRTFRIWNYLNFFVYCHSLRCMFYSYYYLFLMSVL